MADLALTWTGNQADLALAGGDLATGDDLKTAVILSLFTDRRAAQDDTPPGDSTDRRGWWGNAFAPGNNHPIGSRLWLLSREKATDDVRLRAKEYIEEALAWMLADGVASQITVTTEWLAAGAMGASITITRPDGGTTNYQFNALWKAI